MCRATALNARANFELSCECHPANCGSTTATQTRIHMLGLGPARDHRRLQAVGVQRLCSAPFFKQYQQAEEALICKWRSTCQRSRRYLRRKSTTWCIETACQRTLDVPSAIAPNATMRIACLTERSRALERVRHHVKGQRRVWSSEGQAGCIGIILRCGRIWIRRTGHYEHRCRECQRRECSTHRRRFTECIIIDARGSRFSI